MPHLTRSQLEAAATGRDAAPPGVRRHLLECATCRDEMALLSALDSARRELSDARPRSSLRETVLTAAARSGPAAERHAAAPLAHGWKVAAAVAAVLAGAVPLTLLLQPGEAGASRSELRFNPAAPSAGEVVVLEYRPAGMPPEPLVLRGRMRTAADNRTYSDIDAVVLSALHDRGDGVLLGEFTIPDSVVYIAAAVETADGSHTDTNFGRMWEVIVYDAGRPAPAALMQKVEDHLIRNWQVALETSRELTRLHPQHAPGWRARYNREKAIAPQASLDSLTAAHLERLTQLSRHWQRQSRVDAVTAFELAFYAEILGEAEIMEQWKRRLYADHTEHPLTQEFLTVDVVHEHLNAPTRMLTILDSLWSSAGAGHQSLAWEGFHAAQRAADGAAAVRWAKRYMNVPPQRARYGTYPAGMTRQVARVLASIEHDASRRLAAAILEDELRGLDRAVPRLVGATNAEHEIRAEGARRSRLTALADVRQALGEEDAALALLREAAELGWDARLHRQLAGYDDELAATYAARWAVDPETSVTLSDSLTAVFGQRLTLDHWSLLLDSARARLYAAVARQLMSRPLQGEPQVSTPAGRSQPLRTLLDDEVTLVAFWSRWCEPSLRDLARLNSLVARFHARGYGAVTIADEPASPALAAFVDERKLGFPVYHDPDKSGSIALRQWGTPHYFLIDRAGNVRYESRSTTDLLRVADVLKAYATPEKGVPRLGAAGMPRRAPSAGQP